MWCCLGVGLRVFRGVRLAVIWRVWFGGFVGLWGRYSGVGVILWFVFADSIAGVLIDCLIVLVVLCVYFACLWAL